MPTISKKAINRDGHSYMLAFWGPILLAFLNVMAYLCNPVGVIPGIYYYSIILIDFYLMLMLYMAAKCSYINNNIQNLFDKDEIKTNNDNVIKYNFINLEKYVFPTRLQGALTFPLMLLTLVVGFAGVYLIDYPHDFSGNPIENDRIYAIYISFQTMGLNDFNPCYSVRWVVIWQLVSAILFLTALFPLYISRITDIDTYEVEITN